MFLLCGKSSVKEYEALIKDFPAIEDRIHWNVFSFDEFSEGLKGKGTLVYKEIAKNKRIIAGAEAYYCLLAEVGSID